MKKYILSLLYLLTFFAANSQAIMTEKELSEQIYFLQPTNRNLTNIKRALPLATLEKYLNQKNRVFQNVAEMRQTDGLVDGAKAELLGYYSKGDGGGGVLYWDATSSISDNGGSVFSVTGVNTGRWIKIVYNDFTFEMFGAKGDGVTNDSTAIVNCINYVASLPKGGTIKLMAKTYLTGKFYLKKWVNLKGVDKYLAGGGSPTITGSTIKNKSTFWQESFIELYPDNSYLQQTGEKDGLNKSYPNFSITNINFDGNVTCNYVVNISQSWGFAIEKCNFQNSKAYSLNITDCNEFSVTNCGISKFLSVSNADYILFGNDIVGSSKFPAYYGDRTGAGTMANNKIYFGGDTTNFYNFSVASISSGIIKVSKFNYLPNKPDYQISTGGGSVSFIESTQVLTETSTNGQSLTSYIANLSGILELGQTYRLSGQVQLSGVSTNRSVEFLSGNETQSYGSITANNSIQNISLSFVFNPSTSLTSPLKIKISGVTISGVDNIVFTNLKITSNFSRLNGVPMVFNYASSASTTLKSYYTHSESYYPKWLSDSTMVLYSSLYNYTNNGSYGSVTEANLTGANITIPSAVMFLGGRMSMSGTYVNNKIEDIFQNGVLLRGAYNNVFSGNKISKGIGDLSNTATTLFKFEKGAERNTITSNAISARTEDLNDLISICVYFDEFSGANNLTANTIKNANYIGIYDDYLGEELTKNIYDKKLMSESFVYQRKPTDYTYKGRGIFFNKGKVVNITNNTTLISNAEFSLHFENVMLSNITSDATIFQQKDITNGGQDGRFAIRISSAGALYAIINASTIITTSASAIIANKYYNITVSKDLLNTWSLYIDGVLIVTNSGGATAIATGGSTKSYIGAGDISQSADVFMSGFKAFTETLTEFEIKNLNYQGVINNLVSSSLLTSKSAGTGFFSSITAGSVTVDTGTGVDGGNCLKISSLANNSYYLNIPSANVKNKVVRISGYVKSPTLKNINIIRNLKAKNVLVSSSYTKFVKYVSAEYSTSGTDFFYFKFGNFSNYTFGKSFLSQLGDTYLDYVKVSSNYYPCNTDLDFSISDLNRSYRNNLSVTDLFSLSDTYGNFLVKEAGTATLTSGTVTVANVNVTANSVIILTPQETGTLTGILKVSARSPGVSFTVVSSVSTDNNKFGYLIIN